MKSSVRVSQLCKHLGSHADVYTSKDCCMYCGVWVVVFSPHKWSASRLNGLIEDDKRRDTAPAWKGSTSAWQYSLTSSFKAWRTMYTRFLAELSLAFASSNWLLQDVWTVQFNASERRLSPDKLQELESWVHKASSEHNMQELRPSILGISERAAFLETYHHEATYSCNVL